MPDIFKYNNENEFKIIDEEYIDKYGMGVHKLHNESIFCYMNSVIQSLLSLDCFNKKVIEIYNKRITNEIYKNLILKYKIKTNNIPNYENNDDRTNENTNDYININTIERINNYLRNENKQLFSDLFIKYFKLLVINVKVYNENYLLRLSSKNIINSVISSLQDDSFSNYQQDANEFLISFLDIIKEPELEELFKIKYKTETICLSCKQVSYLNENDISHQIDIKEETKSLQFYNSNNDLDNNIENCINNPVSFDLSNDYKCEKCNQKVSVMRVSKLSDLNKIINVSYTKDLNKIKKIPEYLTFNNINGDNNVNKTFTYKLVAMINHMGTIQNNKDYINNKINIGHYNVTTIRRDINNNTKNFKVLNIDDENITLDSFDNNMYAYILFYSLTN